MIRHLRFEAYFDLLYPFWVFDSSELWKSITVCPWLPLVASDSHWFSGCMAWWVFGWMGELMVGPCQITKNGINLDWLSLPCKTTMQEVPCSNLASYCWNTLGEQWLTAMLAIKRSAGVTPEVNLREHTSHTPLSSANKAVHSGFETQRCHQKSKMGVSVAP